MSPTLPFPRVRTAGEHDCARIASVHVQAWREAYAGLLPQALLDGLDPTRRADQWRRHLAGEDEMGCLAIGEDEAGQAVGFVAGGAPLEGALGWDAEVIALYVLARAQRGGLGRRLLAYAAGRFAEAGAGSIGLWVLRDNLARGFYEALGGRPSGERVDTIGGRSVVEVAYVWDDLERFPLK